MKKKKLILFLILFCFMLIPTEVDAKTRCTYHWVDPVHEGETEDSSGNPITTEADFILETEDDENKLTRVISPFTIKPAVFDNGEGIHLNSDGSCPNISIYDQFTTARFKIYESKSQCQDVIFNIENRCSDDLTGTITSTDTSASNETGSNIQYRLLEESGDSCKYERINVDDNLTSYVTLNKRNNNKVGGSCSINFATSCSVEVDVESDFYQNGSFSCPTYIYAYREVYGRDGNNYIVNIIDTGDENDEDRSEYNDDDTREWEQLGDDLDSSKFNPEGGISCSEIFSNEEGTVGWILNTILTYIKIIGPVLVVLLSAIDFIKAVVGFDEKAMKEAQNKLIIRLVAAVCLFLVPTLVQLLLSFINQTTCML